MPQTTKALKLVLLIGLVPCPMEARRNFNIVFHNVTCDVYTTKVQKLDCAISKTTKNTTELSIHLILTEDLNAVDFHAKSDLYTKNKRMNFFNVNMKGCDFLQGGGRGNVMQLIFNKFKDSDFANAPAKCPVKKNKEYYLKNFHFDPEQFPEYTPQMKFYSLIEFFEKSKMIVRYELYVKNAGLKY